jgi:hypothetical protein
MPDELPLPPELEHLIEKRLGRDRRGRQRRAARKRRQTDLGPLGSLESAADLDGVVLEERRSLAERRKLAERRNRPRRRGGSASLDK